ncbi:keratin, type II cytoskeletal 80-like [Spea bombifrons]|uniref:keratin, type II cytoskeletal 80-like n=1 Tax=Spea bombifrons TaxID=233779 RepID=UPI00234A4597|nr:keratin, type II cytoskeletal 80-like [Spea bombifrons]
MATYSQLSDYESSPWQPDTFKARESNLNSPPTSIHYTKDVNITNGSQSEVFEETFKSTLKVTSDSSSPQHVEDTDSKLSTTLASFMDKIRYLEKQREILEDRWAMLQVEENSQKDLEPIYLSYISRLLGQVNRVTQKNHHTQFNLLDMMDSVKDNKNKFEGELFLHTQLEYSFVDMKKDVDTCSLDRTELEIKRRELKGLIELMKSVYEQELKELIEETGDISVLVNMDSSCHLDLESIVEEVKERYESIAARSRKEAQALSKSKLQQGALRAGHCEVELENSRTQISQLNSKIQRMRSEILSVQNQCIHQEQEVSKAKTKSNTALKDANMKLEEVQEALQKAKQDIARQMREYQQLMNVKLSLDIEIVTYKKLLEGEESRLQAPPSVVNVHVESEVRKPAPSRFKRSSSSKSLQSSSSDY